MGLTYKDAGIDYASMDPAKKYAQSVARSTWHYLKRGGYSEVGWSRGESVYLLEGPRNYLAFVVEGLGTKNMVAESMHRLAIADRMFRNTGRTFYRHIGQDTAAMILNDMVTLGAMPLTIGMHVDVEYGDWFKDEARWTDVCDGFMQACKMAGCTWGPGESATLARENADACEVNLSGASMGIIERKSKVYNPANICAGDVIVGIKCQGIHANGLSMARKLAKTMKDGYLTMLDDGRTYGETLLDPTDVYVPLIEMCQDEEINVHYTVNVTGHGWRKIERAPYPFRYVIEQLPELPPVFEFMQNRGEVSDLEMYSTFNMGIGFVLFMSAGEAERLVELLNGDERETYKAMRLGTVEASTEKSVYVAPKNLMIPPLDIR